MKTIVYVDGFNLYYGCLKGTPYRWLNPSALFKAMLPKNEVVQIRYFTAKVTARPSDPDQRTRQEIYFRALNTLPNFTMTLGFFLSHAVDMPLEKPTGKTKMARVIRTDEKGSDVNLATALLVDAFDNAFDCAVVVTNDSDLQGPIKIVKERFKKVVGVLNPQERPARSLLSVADFYKPIRQGVLAMSQFPKNLVDADGSFHKPVSW